MLMRTDPFRELDRLTQQLFGTNGTTSRPAVMPMDAYRHGEQFVVQFDLPGVEPSSIDLDVERNVLTVRAERTPTYGEDVELQVAERPRGVFSRQLFLGESPAEQSPCRIGGAMRVAWYPRCRIAASCLAGHIALAHSPNGKERAVTPAHRRLHRAGSSQSSLCHSPATTRLSAAVHKASAPVPLVGEPESEHNLEPR
jgi:HSP20 family molecular chaperone IbpA